MEELLGKAIALATKAHEGQLDKGGHPYIGHPLRVMNQGNSDEEKIVGVLHDSVEDSELTLEDLQAEGFDRPIIEAIDAITKREGESTPDYLQRVMDNPIALRVKIADMTDNMDLSRISNITQKDLARIANYEKNIITLKNKLSNSQNLSN